MNSRTMLILGALGLGAIGLGAFLSSRDKGGDDAATVLLVPALDDLARLNDVAKVRIEGGEEPFTLQRSGNDWTLQEKAGYPADGAKLRQLLLELRKARRIEKKTASPAGFEALGVQDPGSEGSNSRAVTLFDGKDQEIARVIVGERRFGKGSTSGPIRPDEQSYARVSGDPNAWLAAGKLTFETAPLRWLDQAIFDVARDRIAVASYTRPEGDPLRLVRESTDEFEPKPATVPEGRELKTPLNSSQVLNALAGLRFDDVAKAEGFDWPAQPDVTAKFLTFDGIEVEAQLVERDGKTWARFDAAVTPEAERPVNAKDDEAPPLTTPNPLAEGDEGDLEKDQDAAKPPKKTEEELAAEAQKINAKVAPWVFALPSWKANAFKMKLDDLLAPLPEPTVEPPPTPEGDGGEAGTTPPVEDPPVTVEPPANDPPTGG